MKIIGHRGAAGLAPENTIKAIKAGLAAGADGVEFDIRVTKDGQLVLCHDEDFSRTCGVEKKVADLTLSEIRQIETLEGEPIPTAAEALSVTGNKITEIEGKGTGWAEPLAELLTKLFQKKQIVVISYNHQELAKFKKLINNWRLFCLEDRNPFKAIKSARRHKFDGVDINYRLLNPLTYLAARLFGLEVVVYTPNRRWIKWLAYICYPRLWITTDYPNRFIKQ